LQSSKQLSLRSPHREDVAKLEISMHKELAVVHREISNLHGEISKVNGKISDLQAAITKIHEGFATLT